MSTIDLRTEIIELLQEERNASILEAIRLLLRREETDVEEELTEAELDELDAQEADRLRGDTKMHSREEAMRMMREGGLG